MNWITGDIDIWSFHREGSIIVIPTNAGWKNNGENVMGRGLAKDAAKLFPTLPLLYGTCCKLHYPYSYFQIERLICVPSKRLDEENPHLSWRQSADLDTITKSLNWLKKNAYLFPERVYTPPLGTGNGELKMEVVVDLMNDILLGNPKFIGILRV